MDRVDGYIRDGRLYLRVMDYKSGKKSFSLSDIWYGLNMQLIIYLYALHEEGLDRYRRLLSEELNEIVPAGCCMCRCATTSSTATVPRPRRSFTASASRAAPLRPAQ